MTDAKQGDTHWVGWLFGMPLTGATARLLCRSRVTGVVVVLPSTIADAAAGLVRHKLSGTLAIGGYDIEIEATLSDGTIVSSPTEGYGELNILDDLDPVS